MFQLAKMLEYGHRPGSEGRYVLFWRTLISFRLKLIRSLEEVTTDPLLTWSGYV